MQVSSRLSRVYFQIADAQLWLVRLWKWAGIPILGAVFYWILTRGGWGGRYFEGDYNYASVAGLVPHSDASSYFRDVVEIGLSGQWGPIGSHRPVAAAFRQVLAFAGDYSYVRVICLQAAILVGLVWYSSYRIMLWRGFFPGVAYAALVTLLAMSFVGTYLTEPLGMMWALLSIIFLVEALRRRSLPAALLALSLFTIAMLTRLGAILIVPFFAIWIVLFFARGIRQRLIVASLCVAAIGGPLMTNKAIAYLYADPGISTGGNYAATLCGLSIGGSWHDCAVKYRSELTPLPPEAVQAQIFLRKALENVRADPQIALDGLYRNVHALLKYGPLFLLNGYIRQNYVTMDNSSLIVQAAALLAALFIIVAAGWVELVFWVGFVVAVIVSAALFFADDGWRVLHVSNVYAALLLATALSLFPHRPDPSMRDVGIRTGGGVLALICVLMLTVPALSRAQLRAEVAQHPLPSKTPGVEIVLGGDRIAGVLVVADGSAARSDVPSIPFSEFAKTVEANRIERDIGPFLDAARSRLPFAFMSSPLLGEGAERIEKYVAPARALEDRKAWALVMTLDEPAPRGRIRFVHTVEPMR